MSYQCEVKEQPAQKTLSIRTRAAVQDLPQLLEEGFGVIAQYLGELGEQPIGPPFAAYYNMEIVFTQMTKASMSAGFGGGDDVTDFDLGIIDDDTVNQQFNQLSLLGKGGLIQSLLDSMAEFFSRRCNCANLNLLVDLDL